MERVKTKLKDLEGETLEKFHVNQEKLEKIGLTDIDLRPYQVDGVNWLIERYHRNHGCILGDEMGLGKTCQSVSFLVYLLGSKCESGPCLVLSPLSVTANWKTELSKFAPDLKLLVYQGDKDYREELRHTVHKARKHGGNIPFDVLLTTYELLLKDESFLRKFSWSVLVVDEAHRLKNQESLLHQTLCEFEIKHRLLLTGTPVQNNLAELYSLLCFVAPSIFREKYREPFLEEFENVDNDDKADKKDIGELHKLLQPFLLRRVKLEVLKDLPKKSEVLLYHGLTALQKKYYKAILTKDLEVFENTNPGSQKTRLMNILVQLRKCVNHPYLFDGVEPEPFVLGEHLVEASGKLILIDQLLSFLKPQGHKVLLFSQMTRMLDVIQDYLGYRGYNYERLDGSVRGEERFLAIQNFNEQEDNFVFLLSTKAGGQGLNLTSADTVIFVDSDFNPQNDLQAAARAHRIGQTRPVRVIRLIGRSTVEEIVLRRAEAKLKLTNAVIEGGQFSLGESKESLIADNNIQLQDILKFGLDQLFESEDSSVDDVDFEHILGGSCDGQWLLEETDTLGQSQADTEPDDDEIVPQSMYVFEGTDYSKEPTVEDKKAFDQIIEVERAVLEAANMEEDMASASRPTRRKTIPLMAALPDVIRKPRKNLTPEELEKRREKRKEAAERRAQMEEEEEVRKAQERRKKREAMWTRNAYVSCNITLDSEGESDSEGSEEEGLEEEEDSSPKRSIQYVSGDVTHPISTGSGDAFVLHCADDSGKWGVGGLFSAIEARSPHPQEQYELAGKMMDLALGDCHLIPIDDVQKRTTGSDYLALVIAQHRDRHHNLSGIKLTALSQALEKVYKAAKEKKASVHLPRIGYKTPGFNWYGTERLIRKHLASRGIATSIYYYPRHQKLKRKGTSTTPGTSLKVRTRDSGDGTSQSSKATPGPSSASSSPLTLSDIFTRASIYLHNLQTDQHKKLKRYIIAYDGDVHSSISESTTHVVASAEEDMQGVQSLIGEYSGVETVSVRWVEDCVKRGKKVEESGYRILD